MDQQQGSHWAGFNDWDVIIKGNQFYGELRKYNWVTGRTPHFSELQETILTLLSSTELKIDEPMLQIA